MQVFYGQFQAFPTFFGSGEGAVYGVLVFGALATFVGQVAVSSLIALFGAATTAMVPVDPLECQISQDIANSVVAWLANTLGAADLENHRFQKPYVLKGSFGESEKVKWCGTWVVKTIMKRRICNPVIIGIIYRKVLSGDQYSEQSGQAFTS